MDQRERVYLKEYVEALLAGHERELILRMAAMERALELASSETARRLGELNNLRAEVTSDRGQFLNKEHYELQNREWTTWRDFVSDRLTRIETRSATWIAAIGMFSVVANIVILVLMYRKKP